MTTTTPLTEQRRLALLYRVSREISGRLQLDELLPRVLKETVSTVQANTGSVIVFDEQGRVAYSALMSDGELQPDPGRQLALMLDTGLAGWVVRNRQPALIMNTATDSRWDRRPDDDVVGPKSALAVPLLGRARVVGTLTLVKTPSGAFENADLTLMTAIADQAAIAIENAQLYAESVRHAQAMRALAATSQAITSTLQLDEVLRLVANNAQELMRVEAASIALLSDGVLTFKETTGRMAERVRGLQIKLGQGIAGWVAETNQSAVVPDVRADSRFFRGVDETTGFVTRATACAPVRIHDTVIGVIEAINPLAGAFQADALELLESLASLAGTAIFHAQQVAELQAAESRFAGLFEDNIDPILITNFEGLITDANRKAVDAFGYSRAELIGLRVTTVHRMGTAFLGSDRFRHLQGGREITYLTRITTKQGTEIPMEVHAKLIQRRGQEFIQWIQRDISERLQLEEMRNDLISMIFHDLRSPLGNIISSIDVVQSSLPPERETELSLLTIANRSAMRLSRLVDSLLDLRRLEAGQVVLNKEQVDIKTIVDEAIEIVTATAEGKGIQLRSEVPARLPMVSIDADMIRRVIINIIENAVKYTPGEGAVTVGARSGMDDITVTVRDTGPGIPAAEHTRIFNKYARLDRKAAPKGMGLGLTFCRMAIEAHGGKIWVESQPGKGAVFSFTLAY